MVDEMADYEVGYKKPPIATIWQKGQSGNPSGRPPKSKTNQELNPGKILQSIDNEELVITVDGERKSMRTGEIHFRQLFAKANKLLSSNKKIPRVPRQVLDVAHVFHVRFT